MSFYNLIVRLKKNRRGATAVEYAMIVGAIALGAATALSSMSGRINDVFTKILPASTAPTP